MPDPIPSNRITFDSISLRHWRQFGELRIDFHPRLTILTGANGCGKTSILSLLDTHFAWNATFASVGKHRRSDVLGEQSVTFPGSREIGSISYSNGVTTPIIVPVEPTVQFSAVLPMAQQVPGLAIQSHRMISGYQPVAAIPSSFSASEQLLESFLGELRQKYYGEYTAKTPAAVMKESLLAAQMYGESTPSRQANFDAESVWSGFQEVLRAVLPASLGFNRLIVDSPEVLLETESGTFPLDAISGGISAIFELSWQIFLRSRSEQFFTVCFDEPENHLHPEMQRSLLPGLLQAFPQMRFIVATHSPFVVSSTQDAWVYAMSRDASGVGATKLEGANLAASSDEILRDVLGMESTLPRWAADRLEEIAAAYSEGPLTAELVHSLRNDLEILGLGREYPATLEALARESNATAE